MQRKSITQLLVLFLLSLTSLELYATTWIHYKKDVDYYSAYWNVKSYQLSLKEQRDRPYRFSVDETLSPEKIAELKKDPLIFDVNFSEEAPYQLDHFSLWGVEKEKVDKISKWGAYGAVGAITLHGISMWQWFETGLKFGIGREHWFASRSYSGGADKTGHMLSFYFQKRAMHWMFVQLGNDLETANRYSTLMALSLGVLVEVGDGFSHYLFSYEDVIMNSLGIMLAYYADKYPWVDELVGFKWEYWPSVDQRRYEKSDWHNPTSDYSGQKYWLSFKATGVPRLNRTWARYASIDLGYYTRGFIPSSGPSKWDPPYRAVSVALSLNLSEIVFGLTPRSPYAKIPAQILKYWQPPLGQYNLLDKKYR